MAASKQEASSTNSRKKGLDVDIKIPRDGIGSDHTEKTSTKSQESYSVVLSRSK